MEAHRDKYEADVHVHARLIVDRSFDWAGGIIQEFRLTRPVRQLHHPMADLTSSRIFSAASGGSTRECLDNGAAPGRAPVLRRLVDPRKGQRRYPTTCRAVPLGRARLQSIIDRSTSAAAYDRAADYRSGDRTQQGEEFLQLGQRCIRDINKVIVLYRESLGQEIAINLPQVEMV